MNKIYVIGIGYKPLDKRAGEVILSSSVILASSRLFDVFKGYEEYEKAKDKVKIINNIDETISFLKSEIRNPKSEIICLLASGDPLFFGIGRRAIDEFGKDMVEIIPDLSSIQIAFSRIKEPWGDAFFISLHGGADPTKRRKLEYETSDIPMLLETHNKLAILTDKENNPVTIAKAINSSLPTSHFPLIMYVCGRLGYPDEKIIKGTPAEIAEMSFTEPNVVILQKIEHRPKR